MRAHRLSEARRKHALARSCTPIAQEQRFVERAFPLQYSAPEVPALFPRSLSSSPKGFTGTRRPISVGTVSIPLALRQATPRRRPSRTWEPAGLEACYPGLSPRSTPLLIRFCLESGSRGDGREAVLLRSPARRRRPKHLEVCHQNAGRAIPAHPPDPGPNRILWPRALRQSTPFGCPAPLSTAT